MNEQSESELINQNLPTDFNLELRLKSFSGYNFDNFNSSLESLSKCFKFLIRNSKKIIVQGGNFEKNIILEHYYDILINKEVEINIFYQISTGIAIDKGVTREVQDYFDRKFSQFKIDNFNHVDNKSSDELRKINKLYRIIETKKSDIFLFFSYNNNIEYVFYDSCEKIKRITYKNFFAYGHEHYKNEYITISDDENFEKNEFHLTEKINYLIIDSYNKFKRIHDYYFIPPEILNKNNFLDEFNYKEINEKYYFLTIDRCSKTEKFIQEYTYYQLEFVRLLNYSNFRYKIFGEHKKFEQGFLVEKYFISLEEFKYKNISIKKYDVYEIQSNYYTCNSAIDLELKEISKLAYNFMTFPTTVVYMNLYRNSNEINVFNAIKYEVDIFKEEESPRESTPGKFIAVNFRDTKIIEDVPFCNDKNSCVVNFINKYGMLCSKVRIEKSPLNNSVLHIPAVLYTCNKSSEFLAPGIPRACLLNENYIFANPNTEIVLASDLDYAELKKKDDLDIIYTYWLGKPNEIHKYDWSIFKGRQITYVFLRRDSYKKTLQLDIDSIYLITKKCSASFKYIAKDYKCKDGNLFEGTKIFDTFQDMCTFLGATIPEDAKTNSEVIRLSKTDPKNYKKRSDLVEGIIKIGSIVLLTAPPKLGKTLLVHQMARALSDGSDFLGMKTEKCNTFILDTELREQELLERGVDKIQNENLSIHNFYKIEKLMSNRNLISGENKTITLIDYLKIIGDYILELKYKCLIIDCLYRFINDTSSTQLQDLITWAKKLNDEDVTVVFVHHTSKRFFKKVGGHLQISGHSSLLRGVDTSMLIQESENNTSELSFILRSFKDKKPIKIKIDENTAEHVLVSNDNVEIKPQPRTVKEDKFENAQKFIISQVPKNINDNLGLTIDEISKMASEYESGCLGTQSSIKRNLIDIWIESKLIEKIKQPGKNKYLYYRLEDVLRNINDDKNS